MSVLTRSQARPRQTQPAQPPPVLAFSKWASASSSELPQQHPLEGDVSCSDRAFGGRLYTLAVENERSPVVRTCRTDCLTCSALIRKNQFVSNTTGRNYFAIDIKTDEVHCKLQNYIYLLTCTHFGIQYVGESITPFNLIMKRKIRI